MRKKLLLSGMLAWLLTFGLLVAGCDDGDDDGGGGGGGGVDAELVGKWYSSQSAADADQGTPVYEFEENGILSLETYVAGMTYSWSTSDGKITATAIMTVEGNSTSTPAGSASYKIEGTVLTLSDVSTGLNIFIAGKYYKKAETASP